ncbi:MAG TPA: hypothetical protein HPP77_11265 [Candidatus Hydrogenedentes bacterium]|nr:hypothetical protein [Candidatus Hydrogenedentota bacterium]
MKRCHNCGAEWVSEKRQPGAKEYCEDCAAYLHCCLNCRFHDKYAPNECRIPNTEGVSDRAGANFCDEFEFARTEPRPQSDKAERRAHEAFDALFGGGASEGAKGAEDSDRLLGE